MLEIGWKSFVNRCRPYFEVVKNLSTPSCYLWKSAGNLWQSSEVVGKSSEVVGNLWWLLEVFRNLRQSSEAVGKSSEIQVLWRRIISRILLKKSWQVYVPTIFFRLFGKIFPQAMWWGWQTKVRYSPSANQRPKACSAPRVLPGFSIIGSNWLLHMAVLPCTVIGQVDLVVHWLHSRWIPEYST